MGPVASPIAVYGVALGAPLLIASFALVLYVVYRRRAVRAEAAFSSEAPLSAGPAIVFGTVELPKEAEHAVRVEVHQVGTEEELSGVWSYEWKEKERRVSVRPFDLRDPTGRRIKVRPGSSPLLVDALDGVIRVNLTSRIRYAELTPQEQVYAAGDLTFEPDPTLPADGGAYRGLPLGPVLVPPRHGPMMLSTEPLGERYLKRGQLHRLVASIIIVATVVFQLILTPFHVRALLGEVVPARVDRKDTYQSVDDDNVKVTRYRLAVSLPGEEEPLVGDVPREAYEAMAEGQTIPVRRAPVTSWSTLGPGLTAHPAALFVPIAMLLAMIGGYIAAVRSRPWYEAKVNEFGQGRLAEDMYAPSRSELHARAGHLRERRRKRIQKGERQESKQDRTKGSPQG